MTTLSARIRDELEPVWRDGVILDAELAARAEPLIAAGELVRVTPEGSAHVAGWGTLASTVATLHAAYGVPLELACDDEQALGDLFRRPVDPAYPEPC